MKLTQEKGLNTSVRVEKPQQKQQLGGVKTWQQS